MKENQEEQNQEWIIEYRLDELEDIVSLLNAQFLKDHGKLNEDEEEALGVNQVKPQKTPAIEDRILDLEDTVSVLYEEYLKSQGHINRYGEPWKKEETIKYRLEGLEIVVNILCDQFLKNKKCLRRYVEEDEEVNCLCCPESCPMLLIADSMLYTTRIRDL